MLNTLIKKIYVPTESDRNPLLQINLVVKKGHENHPIDTDKLILLLLATKVMILNKVMNVKLSVSVLETCHRTIRFLTSFD